jgi:hypothetical protein
MKIIEEQKDVSVELIEIKSAVYVGDFAIRIHFADDHSVLVDFKSFLVKASHPSIKKYLDEEKFKKFKLIDGNLNWNDYDMIFPLEDIYQGKI